MENNIKNDSGDGNSPFEDIKRQFNDIFGSSAGKFSLMPMFVEGKSTTQGHGNAKEEDGNAKFVEKIRAFNLKPREIKDCLDRFVIKQHEAKKVLAVAICDHYNHVKQSLNDKNTQDKEYNKQNVLLLGPTGVGKTYLIKNIAKLIGVPFVKVDATKFSETGYVGSDVDDMIRDLVKSANGNADMAQYGIVFIDEIDKIATAVGLEGRDISGRGVQINLLKLMEESDVNLFSQTDVMAQIKAAMSMGSDRKQTINTKHILFIASGAFDKLTDIVKVRIGARSIGFNSQNSRKIDDSYEFLKQASTADFIKFGFEPEFIGRLPVRVACESLKANDLRDILTSSEGSILKQYVDDFAGYNIGLSVNDDAIWKIAQLASEEKTGARGLLTVLERLFRDFKFELPSTNVSKLEITKACVDNPEVELEKILEQCT
ncbi:MAG: AAA family ATPase [Puniceicoccales bacterium]|jgi:endopeptidase Clp ATP-binding regulatory subunit ClpX|nr:AAA family ATPase [Puniceicoccales bacterium]